MREERIRLLPERVQLDRQKAELAVKVVVNYLEQRGPEAVRSLISRRGGIGGIFGK